MAITPTTNPQTEISTLQQVKKKNYLPSVEDVFHDHDYHPVEDLWLGQDHVISRQLLRIVYPFQLQLYTEIDAWRSIKKLAALFWQSCAL